MFLILIPSEIVDSNGLTTMRLIVVLTLESPKTSLS